MEEDEQPSVNIIPCIKWVKRGVAKRIPDKVELTEKELADVIKATQDKLLLHSESDSDEAETGEGPSRQEQPRVVNPDDEFDFESYDKPENSETVMDIGSIAVFEGDSQNQPIDNADNDSEKDDDEIKPSDNLIIVGKVEEDCSILEIYVYNEDEGSLYVHHDFILPSFPLCLEWLNYDPSDPEPGNLCAIGTMTPIIEVWDLDIINCLESAYALGKNQRRVKNKNKSKAFLKSRGHTDAVLCLASNHNYNHILASGSVDRRILLWDLQIGKPSIDLPRFKEKVQSIQWHPFEAHTLLAGCADSTTRVIDCREEAAGKFLSWQHQGEVETVAWNPADPFCYITGTSEGFLSCVDCRNESHLWSFQAHTKEITGLSLSKAHPGMMVTASNDGVVRTWDLYNEADKYRGKPTLVAEKESGMGALQCLDMCPDNEFTVGVGGDKKNKNFKVVDLICNHEIKERFSNRKPLEIQSQEN